MNNNASGGISRQRRCSLVGCIIQNYQIFKEMVAEFLLRFAMRSAILSVTFATFSNLLNTSRLPLVAKRLSYPACFAGSCLKQQVMLPICFREHGGLLVILTISEVCMFKKIRRRNGIGVRTPISILWNSSKLTKGSVRVLLNDLEFDKMMLGSEEEEDACEQQHGSEADVARERFLEGGTSSREQHLEEWVQRERDYDAAMLRAIEGAMEALQSLYNCWTDDADDDEHFMRVCNAHQAIGRYCYGLNYGLNMIQ